MGIDAFVTARQTVTNRFGSPMTITDNFNLYVQGQDALDVVNSDDPQQTYFDILWARGKDADEPMYICDDHEEELDVALGELNWEDAQTRRVIMTNPHRDIACEFWNWCEDRKAEGYELIFDAY